MHLPRRSVKNIQPLPSIYTVFPSNNEDNSTSEHSGRCLIRHIEDGIEVVPLERCNILSAPILSPDQAEKELFIPHKHDSSPLEKPLPRLPTSTLWARLSVKQRILALIGIQLALMLTIGIALLAAKKRTSSSSGSNIRTETTGSDAPSIQPMDPLPRGHFAIPIELPQQQNSACLERNNESIAWQCASNTTWQLNVLPPPMDSNATMITLGSVPNSDDTIYHGHQPPEIPPVEVRMLTEASPDNGPVYHVRTTYDRVVLLNENDLISEDTRTQPIMRHSTFQLGDTLWRCVFNETLIEGYMYPDQQTTASATSNSSATFMQDLVKVPHVLKLVEQRMPNGKAPYCERMRLQEGGLSSLSEEKVTLRLAEPAAETLAKAVLDRSIRFRARQRASESNFCRCQWMVQ
ncbi:hypothetical protein HBH56_003610 [Parastagonospora nodorum]|uniref:DUF7820 domain-containing protein n=2 Tax=Phaeosphaeria nodorum (strain SN15 / ATCC MYA-4574 / FGSC 10173) TaxID=321614 RepID=A0A7U2ENV2_PHANO|nr:hypothetical protein SNOG_09688 [Parastagonospora nodorum SN15]KAH3920368.1 hypothetical protein HBH56_003610 [Parastagonospora nodorum]EAT82953.2 hypothetical protein SNOG_09688 [Parastagonospora nodorum SN15]KAH3938202.1 hypothetical protein HBH54_003600 [Parastagonospora nodorum]KAH3946659.1 hypothetical protein HBH53_128390 [Parastagonospora nodorum]KAH4068668.1 hypothetical protein HBH50_117000 [Parastagonospora nodorum]